MREEIELWAMTKSWDDLNADQQMKVGNTISKAEYNQLHRQFKKLSLLEAPSADLRNKILNQTKSRKAILPLQFAAGIAAALMIGLFSGTFIWSDVHEFNFQSTERDTVFHKTTDTVYVKQIDTLIQREVLVKTVDQTKTIYKDRIIEADCEEIPSNIAADYKVPIQEYVVPLPKKKVERSSPTIRVSIENPVSDILSRPR